MRQAAVRAVDEALEYGVVSGEGPGEKVERNGVSHASAMRAAEDLRRRGKVVRVMHVIGTKSYEVDRYPAR